MKPGLPRILFVEFIRYLGASQAGPAAVLHGAWMLLALAVWQHASGGSSPGDVSNWLVRAYVWLGGTDGDGHGTGANLVAVWSKLSLLLYFLEAGARAVFGPRKPMRLWVVALVSGLVALVGYGGAMLAAQGLSSMPWLTVTAGLFALLAAGATAWAVLARRVAETVVQRIEHQETRALG